MYSSTIARHLLLFFLLLSRLFVQAQRHSPFGEVSISSPTAASIGKFEDVKVNYHTGSPQINIPIYEIQSGPLKLPISMNYHPSGLKVLEPAGWVGAGWALSAGGVITRTVMGAPDERNTSNVGSEYGHFSDYGYNSYLYNADIQDWTGFADGRKDGEPDLFFFNFNGYSGKFYFSDDRTPVLMPQQDLKIEYVFAGSGSISSFIITVPDGTKYYFGATASTTDVDAVEISNPMTVENGYGYSSTISSWFLHKIESADGVFRIDLTYQSEQYSFFTWSSFPIASSDIQKKNEFNLVKMFQNGVRLDKITFPNGHMDFMPGAIRTDLGGPLHDFTDDANVSAKTLGAINITNDNGFCKKWQFYYNYFEDNISSSLGGYAPINTDKKRLRLDSLQESSCVASIIIPPYKFNYYTELVPRRLSFGVDHWGFYNGVQYNTKLIPTFKADGQEVSGANRSSAWPAMRGGALNRITYPTGGYTDFDFGPHRANVAFDSENQTTLAYVSIGYTGVNPLEVHQTVTIPESGVYTAMVSTTDKGSNPSFYMWHQESNQQILVLYANAAIPAQHTTRQTAYFPAGTYQLSLYKDCANPGGTMSGVGAFGSITKSTTMSEQIDTIIGGLRINKITAYDPISGKDKTTKFSYMLGTKSSGIIFSRPVYVETVRNDMIKKLGYWNPSNGYQLSCSPEGCISCTGFTYFISPNSTRLMGTTQGAHFGYSDVKVSEAGNGYSVYRYYTDVPYGRVPNNVADFEVSTQSCNPTASNYPSAPLPFSNLRGELAEVDHFREDNKLLKETFYNYTYSVPVNTTPAFIATYFNTGVGTIILGTQYMLQSSRKLQQIISENNYDQLTDSYISTITTNDFESVNHNEVTTSKTINSSGETVLTKSKYAFDFRTSCDATIDCKPAYAAACSSCMTTYQAEASACGSTPYCATNVYLKYEKCLAQARISLVNCRRTNYMDPNNAFKTCLQTAINNAGPELKPILTLQQTYTNAAIEESGWRNGMLTKAAFNRYDFASTPTGKVVPNKYQLLGLTAPSSTFTSASVSGTTITKDIRLKDEKIITFDKGNIIEASDRDGLYKSYIYDYQNNLPIALVLNANSAQTAYTSFEADGGGHWFFTGTVTSDNTAPTGTKCYNLATGPLIGSGLNAATTYIVSYWTKNANPLSVTGTLESPAKGRSANGWTYYEHKVSGITEVTVSGSGFLDEVKFYPKDAQMRTFTYSPLVGITSESDARGVIIYYSYDDLGRLRVVKDMNGNIIKVICYNYSGQVENCGGVQ